MGSGYLRYFGSQRPSFTRDQDHFWREILFSLLLENKIKKIGVHIGDGIVFMDLNDILYFEADGSYTTIHHKNGKDLAVKKIKHFEGEIIQQKNGRQVCLSKTY